MQTKQYSIAFLMLCIGLMVRAQTPVNIVEGLVEKKKYKEATAYAEKLLSQNPTNPQYNYLMWLARPREKGSAKEYFPYISKAITLDSTYSEAYTQRGSFYLDILRFDDARDDIELALHFAKTDSSLRTARLAMGSYYHYTRQHQKGIDMNLLVLQTDSNNIHALNNLALGYQDLNQLNKALDILYRIERIDPGAIYAVVNIGFVLNKTKDYAKAIEYFNKAEKLKKDEPLVYSNRAEAKYNLKDYSGAMADINKSIKLFPTNSYAYRVRAKIYLAQKNTDKACDDLNTALALKYTEQYDDDVKQMRDKYCVK